MAGRPAARTFEETAELYERSRPGWPDAALDHVVRELGLERAAAVLDLGAGTGKLARALVERFDDVVAVEPLAGMRALLESLVPVAEALSGEAERIPLSDDSVDAVFAAEAFHWFDGTSALTEIARVLRPRGGLVLMWNVPDRPTEPSISAAGEVLNERGSHERQINRYDTGEWRKPFVGSPFEELRQVAFDNPQIVDREGLLAFFASMSWVAVLPEDERTGLLDEVRGRLDAESYTRFWRTEVHWTRLAA
ncbi:MAG TPA: class I SAM-dependent methyltransferase [Gaiellaceae bacterium]|nr:class I SAM-dependent methyltransferase [Gaiellaceae bacterium]